MSANLGQSLSAGLVAADSVAGVLGDKEGKIRIG